ncbi:MAG: nucleobase:cation symporter-2 family protein [Betaproteobacteria bacterium]
MSTTEASEAIHPVDRVLPAGPMIAVGLQHVLVMYAGAIAVPLILGGALKLPKDQIAFLINADLFACGIATLIQCIGIWKFGIRMPVVMGVTFAGVGPMVAMANANLPITAIFGAVIAAGVFAVLVSPYFGKLVRYFPPLVTGTIITVIGITLLRVGVTWAIGGVPAVKDGASGQALAIVAIVLATILALNRWGRGFIANIAVLLGLVVGFAVALALGMVRFDGVAEAEWIAAVYPFRFGPPTFDFGAVISLCLVMVVVMVESTGMFLALGEICDRRVGSNDIGRGLAADGLGTIIGGIFNTFPYTSFSQNVGLVGITGVRSRWVVAVSGVILIALGLFPKMATVIASIPLPVLGGAGLCMFGMVAATGIKILARADFTARHNLLIVAVSIAVGMIPLMAPTFFNQAPKWLDAIVHSGITLAAICAVVLNAMFNGGRPAAAVEKELAAIAGSSADL